MSLDETLAPEIDDLVNGELGYRIWESDEEPEEITGDWDDPADNPFLEGLLSEEEKNLLSAEQLEEFSFQMFKHARHLLEKILDG